MTIPIPSQIPQPRPIPKMALMTTPSARIFVAM